MVIGHTDGMGNAVEGYPKGGQQTTDGTGPSVKYRGSSDLGWDLPSPQGSSDLLSSRGSSDLGDLLMGLELELASLQGSNQLQGVI